MVALLATAFSQREPPAMAAGLTTQDLEILVHIFRSKALEEDVSIVARTRAGQLVGALLTEDFGTPPPAGLNVAPERFAPIGALLDSIDDEYRKAHSVVPGSHLHLFMIAVAASHLRQGIAQTIISCCLENGIARGYRMAVVEAQAFCRSTCFETRDFEISVWVRTKTLCTRARPSRRSRTGRHALHGSLDRHCLTVRWSRRANGLVPPCLCSRHILASLGYHFIPYLLPPFLAICPLFTNSSHPPAHYP